MKFFANLALGLAAAVLKTTIAAPVIVISPGDATDIIITKEDTINATTPAPPSSNSSMSSNDSMVHGFATASGRLPVALVNNFPGGAINAYVTGLDSSNRLVMLQPNGAWYYPTATANNGVPLPISANVAIPLGAKGTTKTITLPGYISSARIWFAEGHLQFFTLPGPDGGPSLVEPSSVNPSDPSAGVNWGFVELTNTAAGGLYANISYVDFVGLILGMSLKSADGMQIARGLSANAVPTICAKLKAQTARDGQPWGDLCQVNSAGKPLRVIAPIDYMSLNPGAFSSYWTPYIERVWNHYTTTPLTINTQAAAGRVNCKVTNGMLSCAGDNRAYAKPSAADIFGCNSGPFGIIGSDNDVHRAVVPRLCAAFTRSTLMMRGGQIQPGLSSTSYYRRGPTSFYSKFVHENEIDGRGYAFSYDDVNPDGENQSGVVADARPELLTVTVGGPA